MNVLFKAVFFPVVEEVVKMQKVGHLINKAYWEQPRGEAIFE